MTEKIAQQLNKIINNKQIRSVFQPIISLKTGDILGYEILSRGPQGSILESPYHLFKAAKEFNQLSDLGRICREQALLSAQKLDDDYTIFINVDPGVICEQGAEIENTEEIINQFSISQKEVVMELTEETSIDDLQGFKLALDNYQEQGYKVAIDDTGAGYSGLQSIVSIPYNYIKLDRSLVSNIDRDPVKKALLKSFVKFADEINSQVIAEGIEREEELDTLIEMGVDYGQGYLIARPNPDVTDKLEISNKITTKNKDIYNSLGVGDTINSLATTENVATVKPTTKNHVIVDIFETNPGLNSIVVIEDKKPVGLIRRDNFYFQSGEKYDHTILESKIVKSIMNTDLLVVNLNTSTVEVAQLITEKGSNRLYQSIIVTKDDQYLGVVATKEILKELTTKHLEQAKNLNPLTKLPGNRIIKQEISSRIEAGREFAVLYADLDNFKIYNDCYGYQSGDQIIKYTSKILFNVVSKLGYKDDFVGHIGGDDFVVITTPDQAKEISQEIINRFEENIDQFFNAKDKKRGCFVGKDRQGKRKEVPLTSLSIAIVTNKEREISSPLQVSDIAAEVKKCVKAKPGSNYMKDRRTD
ncbi:diguanylate cyclase (GGDEF) domain-containing protein [Halobacteroides halobius DSM 5150]|uniref:Diguanylate cyclase (GGDEF) domain-containing protein n=1 Tax=Halobacteroides halobius (strain ATCC 35273 / DSM 5150 / MD-1) TaxID=748449 RepID=L0KB42_HALHC|nr:bifunctional diguanylate cyclase/phosphodiesterase [Halobacteroides halobius]AGB41599.1 diguanylate cyclase (GGDEF) domain-containing protein [Halobacteroides halobius DSM 5150]